MTFRGWRTRCLSKDFWLPLRLVLMVFSLIMTGCEEECLCLVDWDVQVSVQAGDSVVGVTSDPERSGVLVVEFEERDVGTVHEAVLHLEPEFEAFTFTFERQEFHFVNDLLGREDLDATFRLPGGEWRPIEELTLVEPVTSSGIELLIRAPQLNGLLAFDLRLELISRDYMQLTVKFRQAHQAELLAADRSI